jgi:hypothetical protein
MLELDTQHTTHTKCTHVCNKTGQPTPFTSQTLPALANQPVPLARNTLVYALHAAFCTTSCSRACLACFKSALSMLTVLLFMLVLYCCSGWTLIVAGIFTHIANAEATSRSRGGGMTSRRRCACTHDVEQVQIVAPSCVRWRPGGTVNSIELGR